MDKARIKEFQKLLYKPESFLKLKKFMTLSSYNYQVSDLLRNLLQLNPKFKEFSLRKSKKYLDKIPSVLIKDTTLRKPADLINNLSHQNNGQERSEARFETPKSSLSRGGNGLRKKPQSDDTKKKRLVTKPTFFRFDEDELSSDSDSVISEEQGEGS